MQISSPLKEEKSKKALFIYTHLSTFVKGDLSILEREFCVTPYHFDNSTPIKLIGSLIKELLYLLFRVRSYDLVYIWFGDYHSYFPTLISKFFKTKSILVVGGYDLVRDKKLKYGSFTNPIRGYMTLRSLKNAGKLLCVSNNILRKVASIAPYSNRELIYNGVELKSFSGHSLERDPSIEIEPPHILSVALASTPKAFYVKGVDRFNEVALRMPQYRFILVGALPTLFERCGVVPAANLTIIPPVEHHQLGGFYKKSSIYCQFSRHESFSLSLAEALYHNLHPVISSAGGMPEVVGEHGEVIYMSDAPTLHNKGVDECVSAIERELLQPATTQLRSYITNNFTLEIRAKKIESLLKGWS